MADLKVTVRNLYCYPCDLSFSDQDSFRNHHDSPHKIPTNSTSIDVKIETNKHVESDKIGSSSPTKNRKRRKKSVGMEMENSPAVKRTKSRIPSIKSKSKFKRMSSDENQNEDTENNNKSIKIRIKSKEKEKNDSVLQISNKMNLSKYEDYIHCCKCFSTFYTLANLIKHFDKCNIQRSESDNFKDFKQQQQQSHSFSVTTNTANEEENELFNNDFLNEDISFSPFTHDNNNDEDVEEEANITKNDDDYSTSENPTQSYAENQNFNSTPQTAEDQKQDSDNEIPSESESGSEFEPEPEMIESESEVEDEKGKGGKKNSTSNSQQQPKQTQQRKYKPRKPKNIPFKCPVESCSSLSFPKSSSFQIHKTQVHNVDDTKSSSIFCPTCQKSVPSQFDLLCHMNYHTGYKPYKCYFESCDRTFTLRKSYMQHLQVIHENRKNMLKCPDKIGCDGKQFSCRTELRKHMQTCHPDLISYQCKNCDERFLTAEDRYTHFRNFHIEWKFVCKVESCGKPFKCLSDLKSHDLRHQSEKQFQCDFPGCQVKFKQKNALVKHKRIVHDKTDECLCAQCGKTCRDINGYRRHLLVHTQEKAYICQYCGKGFTLQANLKVHTRTHVEERQIKCRFCFRTFKGWDAHERHEETHSKSNPYRCAFCEAVFPRNKGLKKHVGKSHADRESEFDLDVPTSYRREKPSSDSNPIPIPIPENVAELINELNA